MRARHRHHAKSRGGICRARGGGISHHPCNAIEGEGTAPKLHAGKRVRGGKVKKCADGGSTGSTDWQSQPLRSSTGQFISSQGPMAATGPAMFRNSMRSIGLSPPDYNKKAAGGGIHIKKSHKGLLHKNLGVAEGKPIPAKKLAKAEHSSNAKVRKRAIFAENAKHWHH